ncbi:MAG: hypothetical protein RLZZ324_253 [Candidatus Parcubacteria bacterium]
MTSDDQVRHPAKRDRWLTLELMVSASADDLRAAVAAIDASAVCTPIFPDDDDLLLAGMWTVKFHADDVTRFADALRRTGIAFNVQEGPDVRIAIRSRTERSTQ